jgi:hypothetical protein
MWWNRYNKDKIYEQILIINNLRKQNNNLNKENNDLREEIKFLLEKQKKPKIENNNLVFCNTCRYYINYRPTGSEYCDSPLNIYICTTHKEEYKGSKSPFQLNSNNNCKLYRRRLNG